MALTDTEDFFRLSVIAMPKRRSIFDFREQRAKQPCLHGYLATAARVKYPAALQRCKFDIPLLAAGSLIRL